MALTAVLARAKQSRLVHVALVIKIMIARCPSLVAAWILPVDPVAGKTRWFKVRSTLQASAMAIGTVASGCRSWVGVRNILDHPGVQTQRRQLRRARRRCLATARSLHTAK